MIVPGSVADWAMFTGPLVSLSGLAAVGHRWMLKELLADSTAAESVVPRLVARPAA